jgi:hypothetical protein
MKANQNTTSTIAEKDAGLAQGTLLHPAKPSGDGSFVRDPVVRSISVKVCFRRRLTLTKSW